MQIGRTYFKSAYRTVHDGAYSSGESHDPERLMMSPCDVRLPLVDDSCSAEHADCVSASLGASVHEVGLSTRAVLEPPSPRVRRLLIVDDDITFIHILRRTLAAMGDFHFAKSGIEALDLARRLTPDLILLDGHMPGLDGFGVCKALKAETAFRNVPIAFITRFSDPISEMRALDLGASDFIAKPYTPAVLQARVRNMLDLKRRLDAELQAVGEHWRQVADVRVAEIVGAASDAILTYDAGDRVVLINAAACHMFGLQRAQAIGMPIRGLLKDDLDLDDHGRTAPVRKVIVRTNGEPLVAEMIVSSVGKGSEKLTTVLLRDVSDRERLEAETRSRIEAVTASRTKTLMLSYIAHEMGNPLNCMLGFAQLMATDANHPLSAVPAKRVEHILASGKHLEGLMRDVMDLGSFETGNLRVEMHPVNATRSAQDAVAAVSALAESAGVTLEGVFETSVCCAADAARLHQCLVNLLTNAIKYNRRGGWVRVEVLGDSNEVAIAIRDNGFGLNQSQRQHLFEPFNRLGRQLAGAPGAGLGLVITRRLVEAMKGQLRVESEPKLGSCFSVVLRGVSNLSQEVFGSPSRTDLDASISTLNDGNQS